eukprot:TRINITY_DN2275_c0_g1_i2.p1 TRINITY_DN2275_c0_g1~~TRINITY_DN2275_c0_g1_i2.p1  ORF type:complete len:409 (-),score=163.22 TRINITY_DN2275_c0_g1_i2:54-1280(-)
MALVNIPRDRKDQFYRYKMPEINAKVEGRGNGIKTVIVNMAEIAKSLDRPPSYPTKFFGFELGALTSIDDEKDRYIVNGKHDQSKLAEVLDTFIEKFVLCHSCERNPETKMILKGDSIELKCKACGGRNPVDMRHKLTTYITKNPPPKDKAEKKVADRQEERSKLTSGSSSLKSSKSRKGKEADVDADGEEEAAPVAKSSSRRRKQQEDDEHIVWHTDTSAEAVEARRKQLLGEETEAAARLLAGVKVEDASEKLASFLGSNPTNEQIVVEISKLKEDNNWSDEQTSTSLFTALFGSDILSKLKGRLPALEQVGASEKGQRGIIDGVVQVCGERHPDTLLKSVGAILKALYDEDVLSEEAIQGWYEQTAKQDAASAVGKVRKAAQPLVEWLKNAEEESDGDEDEESDE